jgi:hypothetical protein
MDKTFFYELKMEHKSWREGLLHMQLSVVKKGTDVSSSVRALLAVIKLFADLAAAGVPQTLSRVGSFGNHDAPVCITRARLFLVEAVLDATIARDERGVAQ